MRNCKPVLGGGGKIGWPWGGGATFSHVNGFKPVNSSSRAKSRHTEHAQANISIPWDGQLIITRLTFFPYRRALKSRKAILDTEAVFYFYTFRLKELNNEKRRRITDLRHQKAEDEKTQDQELYVFPSAVWSSTSITCPLPSTNSLTLSSTTCTNYGCTIQRKHFFFLLRLRLRVTMKERNALKNKEYVAYSAEILVNVLIFIYVYIQ